LIKYIEYNTPSGYSGIINKGVASSGTAYTAMVTHVGTGVWTASIDGLSLGYNEALSGMTTTQYQGESFVPSDGQCNNMDYYFSSSSPWGTSSMSQSADPPYVVDTVTANGWHSHGP
jgi:hypothetical protein